MKGPITTHVLDVARGRPAEGIHVILEKFSEDEWVEIGHGRTDADGRIMNLLPEKSHLVAGTFRLTFETASYFQSIKIRSFFPLVQIIFQIEDTAQHYHVPLLLSPFGYSTYRGS